jgi:cysteine desulfurase family protein (TIGR01976 family)
VTFDVAVLRSHFPALAEGAAHFDGPGGSQVPGPVGEAMARVLTSAISNRGTVTRAEQRAEAVVRDARAALGDFVGTDPRGVVFGRSMTALTYDLSRAMAKTWLPGDEVVVTRLDHDANVRPWVQAAESAGAGVRWLDFDPETGELDSIEPLLSGRTRVVAVTAASNIIGTMPDVRALADLAHAAGALVHVDAVHYAAHVLVDRVALGADVLTCSPYKFLGPHCGVLTADPALLETLHPDKLLPSSDAVPERFELGTLPYEILAGAAAAVDFLAALAGDPGGGRRAALAASWAAIEQHEDRLRARIETGLVDLGATVYSRAAHRTPTLLASFEGHDSTAVRKHLAEADINAPAGCFYAVEASRRLGLGDGGALRLGVAPYTDDEDVDRLLAALATL